MNRNVATQLSEDRGVDIRFPSTAILAVDSADRYSSALQPVTNPTSPYDFLLNRNQNFLSGFFTRLALTEVVFPWAIPTITRKNSKIDILYIVNNVGPGVTYTIDLYSAANAPPFFGWTTAAELAGLLQTAVRNATGNAGFTITTDGTTQEYTANSNNADTFFFNPNVDSTNPNRTTLYQMMRWYRSTTVPDVIQFSGTPSMLWTRYVDIVCEQLTYNQDLKDSSTAPIARDMLARVYLIDPDANLAVSSVGSTPFIVYRDYSNPKQIRWSRNQPVGGLRFQVYDDSGEILTGFQNSNVAGDASDNRFPDWNITLLVTEQ
jgi:hypothetical protein